MGGSKTQVIQPTPPPAPSTSSSVSDYVAALPKLFEAQLQYAPQEAAQQVQLAQQYAYPLGQAMREAQRGIAPELTNLQDELARQASEGSKAGLSEQLRNLYRDEFKALVGGNVNTGLGADFVSKNLLDRDIAYKQFNQNLGLALAGLQPIAQPFAPNITSQLQGINAGQALNYTAGNYGAQLGFGRPFLMPGTPSQLPNYLSSIGGGLTGIGDLRTVFK